MEQSYEQGRDEPRYCRRSPRRRAQIAFSPRHRHFSSASWRSCSTTAAPMSSNGAAVLADRAAAKRRKGAASRLAAVAPLKGAVVVAVEHDGPPELLSASASGLCKLPEPTAAKADQNHHCGCRWDCERKKETLVLSQPFPGEKSVAPPCLAAGNATAVVTAAALGGYRAAAEPVRRPSLFRFSRSFFGSWLGAEALVAGDFELRRKELMRRLDYGFAC
ncbi:uncharacterized protein DS421_11g321190 [Arachis hypogaea]|nr:uncharacterized protein DS421_11g321190 [Arachis hypogaea]